MTQSNLFQSNLFQSNLFQSNLSATRFFVSADLRFVLLPYEVENVSMTYLCELP